MREYTVRTALTAVLAGAVALTGCQDLDVTNPNAPLREELQTTAADLEALIGSSYRNIFYVQQKWAPGPAQSTAADDHTASWGNYGMQDFGNEPRQAINNNPSYTYAYVVEEPWFFPYRSIVGASDGLRALSREDISLSNPVRARAFAKFIQGMGHALLAANYDRAFVVDETTDPANPPDDLMAYRAVMDSAMGYFRTALDIANGNSFTLKDTWIPERSLTSAQFARLIHSYMARFMSSWPRTPAEAETVDWAAVAQHADAGIQEDFWIGGQNDNQFWWSVIKSYGGGALPVWSRIDLRTLGPADTDGDYQQWLQTPAAERQPFLVNTPDRRITGGIDQPDTDGSYVDYFGSIFFRPGRGTYHFSNYMYSRWPLASGAAPDVTEMTATEVDLLRAEALLRMDGATARDTQEAVAIVNRTRTENGELPGVTADGVPESDTCVPRTEAGACGSLMDALQYEKRIETFHVSSGISFWDDRRWGDLVAGTPVHFPIPGQELQVLRQQIYTFGGTEGGAAGSGSTSSGSLGEWSVDERVQFYLDAFDAQMEYLKEIRGERMGRRR